MSLAASGFEADTNATGEFTMEYKKHAPVLGSVQKDMIENFNKKSLSG